MNTLIYTNQCKKMVSSNGKVDIDKYLVSSNIDGRSFCFLKFLENQQIDGKQMEDLCSYDGIPLYYFNRPTIFLKLKILITCITILQRVTLEYGKDFLVQTDNEIMKMAAEKVFNLKTTEATKENSDKKNSGLNNKYKLFHRQFSGALQYLRFKMIKSKSSNMLICSHAGSLNLVQDAKANNRYYDTQIGLVTEKCRSKFNVLNLQLLNSVELIDKTFNCNEKFVPFELFIAYKRFIGEKLIDNSKYKDELSKLSSFNYQFEDYDLKELMLCYILKDLKHQSKSYLIETLSAERFLSKNKIERCLIIDEGDRGRCFIIAANRLGIKSFASQHGVINKNSPAYAIISKFGQLIVPKATFFWGDKYKQLLLENSNAYNDKNIKVVGQVRTDFLVNRKYNDSELKKESIKILYCTQYFVDLLEPATIMLFKALNLLKEPYELIIKLHPIDLYYDFYTSKIEEYNINNAKILKDGDLYDLINWSDVIVSVHSTVVVEGALLNKPSTCILLPKYNDAGGFVRDGVSVGVSNEFELAKTLVKLKDIDIKKDEGIQQYLDENFYKVDGKVSERIFNIVGE
ncbi:CDP-glycerol glycerophosphotransferase family protein [Clostridium tagluense]|uniref:CDP-glycerol glycerophosphotransferase family protein n=1 Tax=Clostridium tagluense TaxID=360422 RepID=UPI001CF5EE4F|nr:CDP-glycerol glycerophosphotransferase family protein [Clostridium tagluense]MCB2299656.1 CDP-glycerol glycerophosphotransferase family protein [Clostridium tagluense]